MNSSQQVTDNLFPSTSPLNRIYEEAPFLTRCSYDKTATLIRPRKYAFKYPYMQINRPGFVSWLIFDLDHDDPMIWDEAGLPPPNLIVQNKNNRHAHLYYAIEPVCTTENARIRPINYMKAVYAAFGKRLKADANYNSGPIAKTPGHPWWQTSNWHCRVFSLGELAEFVELEAPAPPWTKLPDIEAVSNSRHCTLFEELRFFAYSIVGRERERGCIKSFTRKLETFAFEKNNYVDRGFNSNLSGSSVMATVRSVARWTWNRYKGSSRCHKGAMRLDKSMPLKERQTLAAEHTHTVRRKQTISKLRTAWNQLRIFNKKVTIAALARYSRLTRQTVASYKIIWSQFCVQEPGHHELSPIEGKVVKYGVHQVTRGFTGSVRKPDILHFVSLCDPPSG